MTVFLGAVDATFAAFGIDAVYPSLAPAIIGKSSVATALESIRRRS